MKRYSWLLSAILLGLSYPSFDPIPTGILAWFAFVPFLLANRKIQPFKSYLLKASLLSIVALLVDVWWVNYYSFLAYLVCVFSQFLFVLLPLLAFYFLQKRFGWNKALILLPFVWTLSDFVANQIPHGLQVYLLAYTQANNTWLIQFADTFGMWGVGFWVVMMNSLVAMMAPPAPDGGAYSLAKLPHWGLGDRRFGGLLVGFLVLPIIYSFFVTNLNPKSAIGSGHKKTKISLIQTNIDSYTKDSLITQKTFEQIVKLADSAVLTSQPDLIILPETAFSLSLFQNKPILDFTKKTISAWQTSVAIGYAEFPDSSKKHIYQNKALVFTPQLAMFWDSLKIKPADVKIYQKQYGLPFVELMPYFEDMPTVQGTAMQRGNSPLAFNYLNFAGERFKVALTICWEQTYPHKMAELVNQDAEFIALMNNDAWFGTTPGAKQLLSFTRMRAIENRRTIARCSNGGISCFVDPFGKIYGKIPWFTENISTQEVLCVSKKSFYTQHPYFFLILVGVTLLLLILYFEFKTEKVKITSK